LAANIAELIYIHLTLRIVEQSMLQDESLLGPAASPTQLKQPIIQTECCFNGAIAKACMQVTTKEKIIE
jgi:hypothetical protein